MEVPSNLITRRVGEILQPFDASITAGRKQMNELTEFVSGFTTTMERLSTEVDTVRAEAAAQREAIKAALTSLRETCESANSVVASVVSAANDSVKSSQSLLRVLENDTAATLRAVQSHRENLASEVATSADLLSQVHSSLVSLTRTVVEKVSGKRN
jgi:Mg2+ and Co2+ transporter CorA